MLALTLRELAEATHGEIVKGDPTLVISGHCDTDSRNINVGDVFFAKPGEHDDGHRYLDSIAKLAAVAFVMTPRPDLDLNQIKVIDTVQALTDLARYVLEKKRESGLKVVGITGSNGKTSTKNMLREILSKVGPTIAPRDSFNNEVGLPLTVLKLETQTEYLVLEMGAAGLGSIEKLASWCKPDIGVQLKVGLAHAGAFGGVEQTAVIKAEMMPFIAEAAVLNFDDPVVRDYQPRQGVPIFGFGYSDDAQYQLQSAQVSISGTNVRLRYPDGEVVSFDLKILGEHQAMNASAALAVADLLGVDRKLAISAISELELAERWRMQPILRKDGVLIINDAYNASPDSMRAALQTLATLGRQGHRTVAVLGYMAELGEYSNSEHEALGRLVVRYNIDKLYVVGIDAKLIHMSATQEGSWDGESEFFENASACFEAINAKLASGDIVLVKSSNVSGLRFLGDELAGAA